jgi:ubiquinone/menaquinone biosynthesis C-methylase UbiE
MNLDLDVETAVPKSCCDVPARFALQFADKFLEAQFAERWHRLPEARNLPIFAAASAPDASRARVLDACCGTGRASIPLLGALSAGEVIYVDRSSAALHVAEDAVRKSSGGRRVSAAFLGMPVQDIPWNDIGLLDRIVIRYALHLVPAPEQFLRSAYRSLRPGGRIIFNLAGSTIFSFTNPQWNAVPDAAGRAHPFFAAFHRAATDALPELSQSTFRARQADYANNSDCSSWTWQGLRALLHRAGISPYCYRFQTTWFDASFEDKLAYARTFGAPPMPAAWEMFNALAPEGRQQLLDRIVATARRAITPGAAFRFLEPLVTIEKPR